MTRILLIDDEPDLLEMCEVVLVSAGYAVTAALGPSQALELAAAADRRPDVVLLDLVMPRMGGQEVFRRLQELPQTAGVPVVIMSALPDAEDLAVEMGANTFIGKPFGGDALVEAIEQTIARVDGDVRSGAPPRA